MNYDYYTLEELREDVKDYKKIYEQDKENAINAQKDLMKSELEYYQAKVALLEREAEEKESAKNVVDSIFKVREINYYD